MDSNNDKNNKNGRSGRNLRGVLTLVVWAIVAVVILNYIQAYSQNTSNRSTSHEIKYSDFIELVETGKAESVEVNEHPASAETLEW